MRNVVIFTIVVVCVLFVGCSPSGPNVQATVEVAVAQTQEALASRKPSATDTATPTPTPTHSPSPVPTNTPTVTLTPSITATPTTTNTPTSTFTPTATSTPPGPLVKVNAMGNAFYAPDGNSEATFELQAGSTVGLIERSEDGTWYKIQLLSSERSGWIPASRFEFTDELEVTDLPVSTRTPTPTNTPIPTDTPDIRGEYSEIDIRELDGYTSNYIGDKVKIRGQVFNISPGGLQMWVRKPGGSSYDNIALVVTWKSDSVLPPKVYEDTWITIYGTVSGTFEGTNAYGGVISQPQISADIIEKQ